MHRAPNKNQGLRSRTSNAKIDVIYVCVGDMNFDICKPYLAMHTKQTQRTCNFV